MAPAVAAHPGLTGIHPLNDARDAFAARVLLADVADRSLDVQYYIWHRDLSGQLLFAALKDAADRGVRVRLLLDDNNTSGLDPALRRRSMPTRTSRCACSTRSRCGARGCWATSRTSRA